ncbi:xaa-Pro aminopeptidase 1 [Anopheles gambiae]|uniref:Aminopeptidase P N-terminal domain-containing protein n=1 Tax=Anopheles coluzzii TaxID=1518534 RepID=A0A8W7PKE4_ANOCL|nr:xaa-Pro aminopeptidase 1 [Anopheles gambiae]
MQRRKIGFQAGLGSILVLGTLLAMVGQSVANEFQGIRRSKCQQSRDRTQIYEGTDNVLMKRLQALRTEMRARTSTQSAELDAYLVPMYDEHQSQYLMEADQRIRFLTGFTGTIGEAVVLMRSAAIWTDDRYIEQADQELNCAWRLFRTGERPTVAEYLLSELSPEARVGADPQLVPHHAWKALETELSADYIRMVPINRNLVDMIWGGRRPAPRSGAIKVHPVRFAGERWDSKVARLRANLTAMRCDGMIVTSLTEVAYLLNLRGSDIPHVPVFKAYLLVTHRELLLYTNTSRETLGLKNHLKAHSCHNENCVQLRDYGDVWRDLRTLAQHWHRLLVPGAVVFDTGASEAIHATLPRNIVFERPSPIIFLRAQKNQVERQGMRQAHIRDGVAMCEVLSRLEERFIAGDHITELSLSREIDHARKTQNNSEGIAFPTSVAYGVHSSMPNYTPSNRTNIELSEGMVLIDSGGQYEDGTTEVSRTLHLGEPTAEQIRAYTNVLIGMIRLSMLTFPENLKPAELDALARGPVWGSMNDYPHGTGHGIGSYSSVRESPISISYTAKQRFTFKEGYFFSNEPGYYKNGAFGIRLENVLEVVDTGKMHPTGYKFLAFQDVTLVPFEQKMIDRTLLSVPEKKWLNDYNARIRQHVGSELKRKHKMDAFYWMMNKTRHVPEYVTEADYNGVATTRHDHLSIAGALTIGFLLTRFVLN